MKLPAVDWTDTECIQDYDLRYKKYIEYPGACSLDYQAAMQAMYELLEWDYKKIYFSGIGMFGKWKSFLWADEE